MARFGTNFDDVQGSYGGGAALPEPGVQDFEITAVKDGKQTKGNDAGYPYLSVRCTQMSGESPGTRAHSEFLGLGVSTWKNGSCQKAQFKGFMEAIGREDLLHPDGDSESLKGTTFRARVYHDTDQKGINRSNLTEIEPISHAQRAPVNAPMRPVTQPAAQPAPVAMQQQAAAMPSAAPVVGAPPAQPPTAAPAAAPPTTRRRAR